MDSRSGLWLWLERAFCQRFYALKSGRRHGWVNMIAALCNHQLIARFTVEGVCNRSVFETREGNLFDSSSHPWTGGSHG